jgi:hypothetical protein
MKLFFSLVLAMVLPAILFAQPVQTRWTRTLPGSAVAVRELPGGGFVVAGSVKREFEHGTFAYISRLKANGDIVWTRTYGRTVEIDSAAQFPEQDNIHGRMIIPDSHNRVRDVFALPNDEILLVTEHQPASATRENCRCLIHIGSNGDSLGCRYLCSESANVIYGWDQTPSGELLAFGNADQSRMDPNRLFVLRMSLRGDTLGYHVVQRDCHSYPRVIRALPGGGCVVGGTSGFSSLFAVDSVGSLKWSICSPGSRDATVQDLCVTRDGGVISVGAKGTSMRPKMRPAPNEVKKFADSTATLRDIAKDAANDATCIVRYGAKGDTLWHHACPIAESNNAAGAVELPGGEILVAGSAGARKTQHPFLLCLSAKGDSLWSAPFGSGQAKCLLNVHDGGCLLVTHTRGDRGEEGTTTITRIMLPKEHIR